MKQIARETGIALASIKGRRQNAEWLWQIAHDISNGERAEWRWLQDEVIERFQRLPKWEVGKKKKKYVDLATVKLENAARLAALGEEFSAVGSAESLPEKTAKKTSQKTSQKTKAASKGSG